MASEQLTISNTLELDVQRTDFSDKCSAVHGNQALPKNSRLLKLTTKVDHDGLLRCDGRLQHAENLPCDVRFTIIFTRDVDDLIDRVALS